MHPFIHFMCIIQWMNDTHACIIHSFILCVCIEWMNDTRWCKQSCIHSSIVCICICICTHTCIHRNNETKPKHWRARKQYTTQATRLPHRGACWAECVRSAHTRMHICIYICLYTRVNLILHSPGMSSLARLWCAALNIYIRPLCVYAYAYAQTHAFEIARTVVEPPSSVVTILWEVFVWGFGVLFLPCVCRCWGSCSLSVCVWPVDLLTHTHV